MLFIKKLKCFLINILLVQQLNNTMSLTLSAIRPALLANFEKTVHGYHLVNSDPLKESMWESVNAQIFVASGCPVESKSSGSHAPGSDITCAIGNISNKSAKYESDKTAFAISSYRLTSACSSSNVGTIPEILAAISERKNFQYYSVIVRREHGTIYFYDWYMIPSDHPSVNPEAYEWTPMVGKRGKNKDTQIGWKTNEICGSEMSITFSMSSQLWMYVNITPGMREFCVASTNLSVSKCLSYAELYDMFYHK